MSRRRPVLIEEPPKPFAEMTDAGRAAYVRQLRRALRDDEVRRGSHPPRSMREMEIWHEALVAKDENLAARIARAERRQRRPKGEQEGEPSG